MQKLTDNERICNDSTREHILLVSQYLHTVVRELLYRADEHDATKLQPPEVDILALHTEDLHNKVYGSEDYEATKTKLRTALEHHYARNRHHPEHFKNGVKDMNIIDLIEMLCDWAASSKRHDDGNLNKSIEINQKRFDLPPTLVRILENSVYLFE